MKGKVAFIFVVVTASMAGLVSSHPVSSSSMTTPQSDQDTSPFGMVILHVTGEPQQVEKKQSEKDVKPAEHSRQESTSGSSSPSKKGGFAVVSSSNSFTMMTPIEAQSESFRVDQDGHSLSKRETVDETEEGMLIRRSPVPIMSPRLRDSSTRLRKSIYNNIGKPAGKGFKKVTVQYKQIRRTIKKKQRRWETDDQWARKNHRPHGTGQWNGEFYYGSSH